MTEDIWAEKPEFSGYSVVEVEEYLSKMDAFHEKLKSSFDESIADCHHSLELVAKKLGEYREKAEKYESIQESVPLIQHLTFEQFVNGYKTLVSKLEAIKKWHKAQIGREVDPQDIRELGEILEAEE